MIAAGISSMFNLAETLSSFLDPLCNRFAYFASAAGTKITSHHAEVSPHFPSNVCLNDDIWAQQIFSFVTIKTWSQGAAGVAQSDVAAAKHRKKVRRDDSEGT